MRHPLAALLVLTCAASLAPAQTTLTHLDEDFTSGAVDWFPYGVPHMWHVTAPSECGAPGGWASTNLAQNPCVYGSPGWAWPSVMTTPEFVPQGGTLGLEFLSQLAIDPGDTLQVRLIPPSYSLLPPLVLLTEAQLTNDGQVESVSVWAPGADLYAGLDCHLRFDLVHDGTGDLGYGWRIDEVVLVEEPTARPFCLGDGTGAGAGCPCGNFGAPGEGCASHTTTGARLFGDGSARLAQDDMTLFVQGGPAGQPAVLFRGSKIAPQPFRDGLLCVGPPQLRIAPLAFDAAGIAQTPSPIGSLSGASPGDRHHYQLWYRSPSGLCGSGSNLSSAVTIDWI